MKKAYAKVLKAREPGCGGPALFYRKVSEALDKVRVPHGKIIAGSALNDISPSQFVLGIL